MAMAPKSLPSSPSMNNQISTTTSAIADTPWHERERCDRISSVVYYEKNGERLARESSIIIIFQ